MIVKGSPVGIGSVFGGMIFNLTLGVGIVALVATHTIPLNVHHFARIYLSVIFDSTIDEMMVIVGEIYGTRFTLLFDGVCVHIDSIYLSNGTPTISIALLSHVRCTYT